MMSALFLWLAIQGVQPATAQTAPVETAPAESETQDVYSACFLRELARLEGRDLTNWTGMFSRRNGFRALRNCQRAKRELTATIERELAANPEYADGGLRKIELENRVAMSELPLLLLIAARGQ